MATSVTNLHRAIILGCQAKQWELSIRPCPQTLEEQVRLQQDFIAWSYAMRLLITQAEQMRMGASISASAVEPHRVYEASASLGLRAISDLNKERVETPFYCRRQMAIRDCTYGGFVQNLFRHAPALRSTLLNHDQQKLWAEIDAIQEHLRNAASNESFDSIYTIFRYKLHRWREHEEIEEIVCQMKGTPPFSLAWQQVIDGCALTKHKPEAKLRALQRRLSLDFGQEGEK